MEQRSGADVDKLAKKYRINGLTILSQIPTLHFPYSFPYNFMHLIWENLAKNLIMFWIGKFEGLDEGNKAYQLAAEIWEAIGVATKDSGNTIPSAYGARVQNIARDRSLFTANNYSSWVLYTAPVLLQGKFRDAKYYNHFIELVKLLHICLQFELTTEDVSKFCSGFRNWVKKYEEYGYYVCDSRFLWTDLTIDITINIHYYQYLPQHISACPLTIHALLHTADNIEYCGPVWAYWAFPMERYCSVLQ